MTTIYTRYSSCNVYLVFLAFLGQSLAHGRLSALLRGLTPARADATRPRGCLKSAMLTTIHCNTAWHMLSAGIEIFLVRRRSQTTRLRPSAPPSSSFDSQAILANRFSTIDEPSVRLVAAAVIPKYA
ncbi:hypothetical protein CIB48_g5963 [Xylaria polymorpha]|nr:hypothetical protein CIB48_g5963 [Xylaria polymorpha]